MNKKIIAILSLLIVLMSITAVSAFGLDDLLGDNRPDQNITIDNIKFQLPAEFEEDKNYESINEKASQGGVEYTYSQKTFQNDDGNSISILVGDYGEYKVTDEIVSVMGGEKTTINNVTGYLSHEDDIIVFGAAKNNKLIVITAEDEDDIGEVTIIE